MAEKKQRWVKLGAFWKGKKQGVLTGEADGLLGVMLNGRRLIITENDRKESESHPDFIMSIAPADDEENSAQSNNTQSNNTNW
jgi:predicted RNA-binding protein